MSLIFELIFYWGYLNRKSVFLLLILDETGSFDDFEDSLIPWWFFDTSENFNDSSLLIQANLDCVIERESPVQNSFFQIQNPGMIPETEPVRPNPRLDYIWVSSQNL